MPWSAEETPCGQCLKVYVPCPHQNCSREPPVGGKTGRRFSRDTHDTSCTHDDPISRGTKHVLYFRSTSAILPLPQNLERISTTPQHNLHYTSRILPPHLHKAGSPSSCVTLACSLLTSAASCFTTFSSEPWSGALTP